MSTVFRPVLLPFRRLSLDLAGAMQIHCRLKSTTRKLNLQTESSHGKYKYKCIDDLRGPSLANTAYWLFVKGYADKSHALQVEHKKLYGPIWRSKFGPFDVVNVATADLIAQVIRQEGKYPVRTYLPHWKEYRDMRGQAYGLHVDKGPEWYRIRSALNPKMLKLREVSAYAPVVNEVVTDLLHRIYRLREQSPDGTAVQNLAGELYKFGFEGISSILFEARLGCLNEEIPEDTQKFIRAVGDMLALSETVLFFPKWTRSILPYWNRFVSSWDDISDVAKMLIDRKVKEIHQKTEKGETVEGMYLTYLLSSNKLSLSDIYTSLTELLLGGVDTTSNTMSWTLYHLARAPAIQTRLYREIAEVCPGRRIPTAEHLTQMHYMKAVIKETLRLYPVVPGNGRLMVDNEVILDNYWFPRQTQFHLCHYAASHDESSFPEPEQFVPERWLRDGCKFRQHPYSSIPFGVGVRACVGKRVAELEMYFALSRLMQHFEVRPEPNDREVQPRTRTLMIPGGPINLHFISRD
ncbi:cytochrome P450 27C1-like [Acipenser oxyrinchus oxyrinchus]|uniref:Cytochrome P450 27C1-like n=1 Tax=Acipenser oxyrinchus oxyrinchus TaxID=40147 RepID=A0AAD8DAA5_ACIOX|nr:cytochrome P450 27C1-like [Acipenser oxyrinchus oxyrinchus]